MGRRALDVLKTVCDQLGWSQIVTVENEDQLPKDDRKLVRALNRVLRVMSGVQDWRFLRAEGEIITVAEYAVALARLTNGSTLVTGQDDPDVAGTLLPAWTADMRGRAFIVAGGPLVYRIAAVNSATSITLSRAWQGDSTLGTVDAPDVPYKILQDTYDLPLDMDRPSDEDWALFKDTTAVPVRVVDSSEVRERRMGRFPASTTDWPNVVTLWSHDEQGEHRVAILDPFPLAQHVITFEYHKIHPTIDRDIQRILFPPRYEEIILQGVEFVLHSGPDDDARSDMELAQLLRTRSETAAAREIGEKRRQLTASQDRAWQQRTKWSRGGRRIDWGSHFDRANFYDLG